MKLKFQKDRKFVAKTILDATRPKRLSGEVFSLSSIGWRRGLARGGKFLVPLSSILSPLVPRGERKKTLDLVTVPTARRSIRAFTMVEIALALAIIGFALVAIIGILPAGLSVQKDNREQTVVNMDAAYLMDAIRGGAKGQDDLTNFIIAITNQYVFYPLSGATPTTNTLICTRTQTIVNNGGATTILPPLLTNGANIIGLLSVPKYYPATNNAGFSSNTVNAEFRAINGPALDQGVNPASYDFAFHYRVNVEIVPASDYPYAATNTANWLNASAPSVITNLDPNAGPNPTVDTLTAQNLQANSYQVRLNFRWPILANGQVGGGRQVYRSSAGGELPPNRTILPGVLFWFFNPQDYAAQAQ